MPAHTEGPLLSHGDRSGAVVDALVSMDGSGSTIALASRHPSEPARCSIRFDGEMLKGTYAEILDGSSPDAFNSIEAPDAVAPRRIMMTDDDGVFALPLHAFCMLKVSG